MSVTAAEFKKDSVKSSSKRIGAAAGKFTVPVNFDEMDKEIEEMFEDYCDINIEKQ